MRQRTFPVKRVIILSTLFVVLPLLVGGRAGALDPSAELGQLGRRAWQTETGLPQNTVHSVAQTADGYLWAATEEGVARFDGLGFKVFDKQNTPQLRSNDVRALLATGKGGVLWACTDRGLARLEEGEWAAFTTANGLASDDVLTVHESRDGRVWVGTAAGLNLWRGGDRFETFMAGERVQALGEDASGALWVGADGGLTLMRGGQFESLLDNGDNPAGASGVEAIEADAEGRLWFATNEGLSSYQSGRFVVYTTREGLPNDRVISLLADRRGGLWVGTAAGLARLRDGRFESFGAAEGLSDGIVLSLFEDREGSLWAGTESGGLHQLRGRKFTTYTTREGLSSDLVKAIYEDRAGDVWVGTYGAGLNRLRGGRVVSNYTTKDGLASNVVLALFDDAEGALWVGTPDGLSRFRDGRFTTYTSAEGLPNDFVRSIYAGRDGLWVGTRGGLALLRGGEFNVYTTREGLPNDFVGALYEDARGVLWVGTLGGLSRFEGGRFKSYTTADGLSDNVVISIHGDGEERLYVGTNGGGLNLLRGGKFHAFTTRDGLPNDTIYRILEDSTGRLWMSCNKGIFTLTRRELEELADGRARELRPTVYGTADGMPSRECSGGGHPSAWRSRDGRLWFSTIKGVAAIDPARVARNDAPPPVVVEQVRVDEEVVQSRPTPELPPGKSRFDFHYAGLSFVAPEKVRYRYRLEGFDDDWVDGGDRRVAYYTNLGPGAYRFLVQACNDDGVWSAEPAAFAFTLRPHFYRTYWFYALCVAGLGLVAWQLYALRLRQVRARYAAVLAERNRIAREIHDSLAQEILGASVQLEIVSRTAGKSPETARAALDRARALVRSSIAEARRYVWDLRSQSLDERDLPTALAEMTRRLAAGSQVQTQFEVSGAFRPLPAQVENNLLRIGQEAVGNAVRHARARAVYVALAYDRSAVRLSVRDDGRGFDPQRHSNGSDGHFGIVGMRERAEGMGGSCRIESSHGGGSEVSVSVPVAG